MEHHHAHETVAWRSESTKVLRHLWDIRPANFHRKERVLVGALHLKP